MSAQEAQHFLAELFRVLKEEGVSSVAVQDDFGVWQTLRHAVLANALFMTSWAPLATSTGRVNFPNRSHTPMPKELNAARWASIASGATTACDASRHVSRRRSDESPARRPSPVSGKKKNRKSSSEFSGLPATCQTSKSEEYLG